MRIGPVSRSNSNHHLASMSTSAVFEHAMPFVVRRERRSARVRVPSRWNSNGIRSVGRIPVRAAHPAASSSTVRRRPPQTARSVRRGRSPRPPARRERLRDRRCRDRRRPSSGYRGMRSAAASTRSSSVTLTSTGGSPGNGVAICPASTLEKIVAPDRVLPASVARTTSAKRRGVGEELCVQHQPTIGASTRRRIRFAAFPDRRFTAFPDLRPRTTGTSRFVCYSDRYRFSSCGVTCRR